MRVTRGCTSYVPFYRFVVDAILEAYDKRKENAKTKNNEDKIFFERQYQLSKSLQLEQYLQVKKYGWISFQINAKGVLNAWWRIDKEAVWHVSFPGNASELTLRVSQPCIDRQKLKQSNIVDIAVKETNYTFTSKYVFPLYVRCAVSCSGMLH